MHRTSPFAYLVLTVAALAAAVSAATDRDAAWETLLTGKLAATASLPPALKACIQEFRLEEKTFIAPDEAASTLQIMDPHITAAAYISDQEIVVVAFSQAPNRRLFFLDMNWPGLALRPEKSALYQPPIEGLQDEHVQSVREPVLIEAGGGVLLVLDQRPRPTDPDQLPHGWEKLVAGRTPLVRDRLGRSELDPGTRPRSPTGASFQATAEGLHLSAPANTCAFLEQRLPEGATAVGLFLDTGTDSGMSWGPGLALLWPNEQYIQVNARSGGQYGVLVNGSEQVVGRTESTGQTLWVIWDAKQIRIAAQGAQDPFVRILATLPRTDFPGAPERLRIGKLGLSLAPKDHASPGSEGRSTLTELRVLR